jgi:hypothetical protein
MLFRGICHLKMPWLQILCVFAPLLPLGCAINVLILGDSVDRHIVEDWCALSNSSEFATAVSGWGPKSLKYGGISSIISPSYCANSYGDSIAQIHLFGSNSHGPYYSDKWEMDNSEYEVRDSTFRTTEGIRIYMEKYGVPDRVLLKTVNWDNALQQTKHDASEVNNFLVNTAARLLEIESVVGKDVQLGVMTAPQVWYGGSSVPQLNTELRQFAAARNLLMYDFDQDVWSTAGFKYNEEQQLVIMRSAHDIHPKPSFSARAGEKILGRLYSGYFLPQGRNNSASSYYSAVPKAFNDFVFVRSVALTPQHEGETAPTLSVVGETLTYLEYSSSGGEWHRWSNVHKDYLRHLHLGHRDVMSLLHSTVEGFKLVGTIPGALFDPVATTSPETPTESRRTGMLSQAGKCVATVEGGRTWLLHDREALRYLGIPDEVSRVTRVREIILLRHQSFVM